MGRRGRRRGRLLGVSAMHVSHLGALQGAGEAYGIRLGDVDGRRRQDAVLPVVPELVRALLNLVERLADLLALVRRRLSVCIQASHRVARQARALCLLGKVLLGDVLVVLVDDVCGDALHAEDLNVQALAAADGVLDVCEVLLVHLVHVHRQTCACQMGRLLRCMAVKVPPAVFSRLPQRSHLKCFAF